MSYNYDSLVARYTSAYPDAAVTDLHDWLTSAIEAWTDAWGDEFDDFTAVNGLYDYNESIYLLQQLPLTPRDSAEGLEDLI